ncbi:DUF6382 domain-containing protein [Carnobacterium gallinarum]|uniref:DUF6382 domain-containing protein n=1 Tax=Carnobacterium gallinarum TaxID=2749 RepID=UPI0005514191|nr:DUF6382 domain-containing protein [Carnobacterium gallinarum]
MKLKKEINQRSGKKLVYCKESGAAFKEEDFIEIEKKMLEHNRIQQLLPIHIQQIDFEFAIDFSLDEKRSVADYIQKNTYLKVEEIYVLLLEMIKKIEQAEEYMLNRQHFLIEIDTLFYVDSLQRVELVYLPLNDLFFQFTIEEQIQQITKKFLQKIDPEAEIEVDLEELLTYLKEPHFSIQGLRKLVYRQSRALPPMEEEHSFSKQVGASASANLKNEATDTSFTKFMNLFKKQSEKVEIDQKNKDAKNSQNEDFIAAKGKLKKDNLAVGLLSILALVVISQLVADKLILLALGGLVIIIGLNYSQKMKKRVNEAFPEEKSATKNTVIKESKKEKTPLTIEEKNKRNKIALIVLGLMALVVLQQLIDNGFVLGIGILIIGGVTFLFIKKMGLTKVSQTNPEKNSLGFSTKKQPSNEMPKQKIAELLAAENGPFNEGNSEVELVDGNILETNESLKQASVASSEQALADFKAEIKEEYLQELQKEIVEEKQLKAEVDSQIIAKSKISYTLKSQPKKIESDSKIEKKMSTILKNKVFFMNAKPLLTLERFEKNHGSEKIDIHKKHFLVGRNENRVDYFENEKGTSRIHFELFYLDDVVMIRDLNSKHGTFLNEFKLQPYEMYEVKENDRIQLKSVHYLLKNVKIS